MSEIALAGPTETLRQYTDRRSRQIAAEYGITQVEVRGLYDWRSEWVRAVVAAAEAGGVIPKRTLDALDRYDRYLIMHNHPNAIPRGYVAPVRTPGDAEEATDER